MTDPVTDVTPVTPVTPVTAVTAVTAFATADGDRLADPGWVGNKFARLELLRRAGFRVPEFFCLPATAFDQALDALRPQLPPPPQGVDDEAAVDAWCAAARRALAGATLPPALAALISDEFDTLLGADGLAAVRACVVPSADADGPDGPGEAVGEDSAVDPFAGMSDSFLYVPREGLAEAVLGCWASAFNPQAVRYRLFRGIDPTRARVAVGIQRMVLGTRSFVAFTRDPRDGSRRHLIAAAHGIGEGVVQEKADVDHFFVDLDSGQVSAETVHKAWRTGLPEGAASGAPVLLPVPAELADPPVLDDRQARAVAALAAEVENLFGAPQDIEGAITADGVVHLVQARPLVVGPLRDGPQSTVYWGNHNITESFPGVSGALTYSQAREFYRRSFGDLYRRMGVPRQTLRENGHRLVRMVGYLEGQVYYRLNDWHELHSQMPMFDLIRTPWEEAMGITGPARGSRRWSGASIARATPGLLRRTAVHPWQVRRFLQWWDRQMAEVDSVGDSPDELIALYRRIWDRAEQKWGITLINGLIALIVLRSGTALLRRWTGLGPQAFVALLAGGRENRSLEAVRAAMALAELVGTVPGLRQAVLDEEEPQRLWADLVAGRYGRPVAEAALQYVARYGDRALHDLKLEEPTPRQRPWTVLAIVRPLVRQGATVAANRAEERASAERARLRLREICPGPLRRGVLLAHAALARDLVRVREDTRFCRTQLYGMSRDVMWRLGAELARTGVLDDPLDVADLTVEEVIGAFDGTGTSPDLRALAALRRTERLRWAAAEQRPSLLGVPAGLPLATALEQAVAVRTDDASDDQVLRGIGSSVGVVRGRAKVVLDPGTEPDLGDGRILIARETDPGWLFLMMSAKGMVVERGTLLSHTAITGRLLGIPTVVAVQDATRSIPDGAWIELDGGAGTVRLLPDPEDPTEKAVNDD